MTTTPPVDITPFARLARNVFPQSRLLRAWPLLGGVSAQTTALEIQHSGGRTQKLVVRQHGPVDLAHNPHIAADEFRLMEILRAAGLPTATPYYLDQSGELFTTPVIVLEYIEGESILTPIATPGLMPQLAAQLARIHQVESTAFDLSFLRQQTDAWARKINARPAHLDDSLEEGRIREALQGAWPWPQGNASVLLHGDYWPGNVLWRDGQLIGVIDWEDAALGDPLADIANCRLEILWAFGSEAMHSFTWEYASIAPIDFTNLPYWDLCAALQPAGRLNTWAADAAAEARMRERHRVFVAQAFQKLAAP
ncbi:MAG TPA: phosphotransferase family protein [Ktedonobacterales bacterium]|nr:phosphotransferase family protein [Ktedonobacterales bacterium]